MSYALSPAARACLVAAFAFPGLRGLALGYTLSPAARAASSRRLRSQGSRTRPELTLSPAARAASSRRLGSQGSRTRPGLHAVARCAGLPRRGVWVPRARGLALSSRFRPLRGLPRRGVWVPGLADSPWATRCRPAARAASSRRLGSQGSRTRPGLHAVARCAGCLVVAFAFPGLADSPWATRCRPAARACLVAAFVAFALPGLADLPWATRCRPLRGLPRRGVWVPRARGLARGYTLSPAARACLVATFASPGLADSPWATRCRPLRGLPRRGVSFPGLADSPWAHAVAARAASSRRLGSQGSRTRPELTLSPAARAASSRRLGSQGSRTRLGLHAVARCAGCLVTAFAFPGLADSPWATRCRPLRGLPH